MRRWEVPVFFGAALAMHVAAFALTVEGGQDAAPGGAGGDGVVTVAAASPEVAALVEEWEAPPDAVEMAEAPSPTSERPEALTPPRLAPAPAPEARRAPPPLAPLPEAPLPDTPLPAPALEPPRAVQPEESVVPPEPEPEAVIEPAPPQLEPMPEETEPVPTTVLARSTRPAPRPDSVRQTPPPAEPDPAPQAAEARAEQRAAGPRGPATQGETGQAAVATASPGEQADLVQFWGAQIQARLQRALVYPRQAQMRGIAGQTVLELTVGADGRILGRQVVGSSGSELLDQAALSTVDRASGIPPAPSGLPGSSFTFQLPVVFQGR